jgi:hypothetical protein
MRLIRVPAVLLALVLAGITVVRAQSAPPPVSPPPAPGTAVPAPPTIGVWVVVDQHNFDAYAVPADFHYTDEVHGYDFAPGERVTVTPHNLPLSPVTVTADQYGAFAARFTFVWQFCGPHAVAAPAPSFDAQGDQGSSASTTQPDPGCPALIVAVRPSEPPFVGPPVPISSTGTSGGVANPAGTAVPATILPVGTAVTGPPPPGVPGGVPIGGGSGKVTTNATVSGFGFAPGERVTLTAQHLADDLSPTTVNADDLGRFRVTLSLSLPCLSSGSAPVLTATGDQGTTVTRAIAGFGLCMQCPTETIVCPVAPAPGVPAPSSGGSLESTGAVTGLAVRHSAVRRGHMQQVMVEATGEHRVGVIVRYAGGGTTRLSGATASSGQLVLHWRVPVGVRKGIARVTATFQPASPALSSRFRVR